MTEKRPERRLAALFAADAVGYSRQMEADEAKATAGLAASRREIDRCIDTRGGRIISTAGDSVVAEFPSSVDAVNAALAAQDALVALPPDGRLDFRIGIHFGDVLVAGPDLLGDGINVAARLETLAPPGGVAISATVHEQIVGRIDRPFGPGGRQRLKNLSRPVDVWVWPETAARALRLATWRRRATPAAAALALAGIAALLIGRDAPPEIRMPTGPKIAVMPFDEIGAPDAERYFADGLGRDVGSLLSQFSNLFVLSPDSTARFRGDRDCATLRERLGADFILSGTVRRTAHKLRVTTTFTDTGTCRELDAPGPFDRDLTADNVLDVQLDIARRIVAQIGSSDAPIFDAEVVRRMAGQAPDTLTAYQCVLLSYWFYENFDPERHRRARDCLKNAVEEDPDYSLAWSRLAFAFIEAKKYAIDTPPDWAERAKSAAQRAIALDPENPDAYYARAILSQMTGEERSVFRTNAERAVALNPNDAFILADLGTWMAYSGAWETGKEWVQRAMLLNPTHQSWWHFIWQLHAFLEGDYAASLEYSHKVDLPGNYMVQAVVAAAEAMAGDTAKAAATVDRLLALKPDYADDPRQPFRARGMPQDLIEGIMAGLERAGLDVPPPPPE